MTVSPAAGSLNQRITIESYTESQGDDGDLVKTWAAYAVLWASVEPTNGTERWRSDQVSAEVTHRVMVLYTAGVTPAMRIVLGARHFDILSVVNRAEENRTTEILAKEHV